MEQKIVPKTPSDEEKEALYQKIADNASQFGYFLNPDKEYDLFLMGGLLVNASRYGYASCPCRRASGDPAKDLDLVCPCDYRDADLDEFGMCYCSLYVSREVAEGKKETASIPERRRTGFRTAPSADPEAASAAGSVSESASLPATDKTFANSRYPVWRCRVCGYLCARDEAPAACPICKAEKERFERFA